MMIIPTGQTTSKFNKPIYGIAGKYTLSQGISLPYFHCNLDINRAIDELRIAEQIPPSLETKWSLNELFQREIDEERVRHEIINGYLLDARKIKFFNAITIVLMPKGPDGGILDSFDKVSEVEPPPVPYESGNTEDEQWNHPGAEMADFGGVQYIRIGISARLRWDETRVLAVAVDGQHRLWALRTFREDQNYRGGTLQSFESETTVPIIFVLLHERAGFQNTQRYSEHTIRGISRELFTDLNKNAKTVDRARELILDDRSITALCVRTLLTMRTAEDSTDRLPLSLIRWQDDVNRFDTSYYLNSIVHLELVLSDLLDLNYPRNPLDKSQVERFIKSVNDALGVDGEVTYKGRGLTDYYEKEYCNEDGEPEIPFVRLPEQYLGAAVEGFDSRFRPWILRLLLEFKPYRALLSYARGQNLIEGTFGKYWAQTKKHRAMIKAQESSKHGDEWYRSEIQAPINEIEQRKQNQWAFKAIFQKAMLRLAKTVEFQYKGTDPNLGNIDNVLRFMDRLYDSKVLEVTAELQGQSFRLLWTFIALNPGNEKIKVSAAVEARIYALLLLWYYGSRKIELDEAQGKPTDSARKLLTFFSYATNTDQWPSCSDAYNALAKAFETPAYFGGEMPPDVKKRNRAIKRRLTMIFTAGLPNWPGQSVDDEEADDRADELVN